MRRRLGSTCCPTCTSCLGRDRPLRNARTWFRRRLRHPPNVDGGEWFVEAVFPLIRDNLRAFGSLHRQPRAPGSRVVEPRRRAGPGTRDITLHGRRAHRAGAAGYGAGVKGKVNLSKARPAGGRHILCGGRHAPARWPRRAGGRRCAGLRRRRGRLLATKPCGARSGANGLDNVARHFLADAAREVVRRCCCSAARTG